MGTLSARALRESLQKAKNIGIVEERFQLFGDLELVVRNLRPDEYESIAEECKDEDGLDYLYAFQFGHVKRAIVELNGQDLRDVQYVEDEEEDPKKQGQTKTVKLELPDWLAKNYISTWGKEAIYVAFRKVEDAVEQAERKAKAGIEFITPDETDEDKFRRLVGEIKELEDTLPAKLYDRVLDDHGLMRKSTADEIKRAMERADQLAKEEAAKRGEGQPNVAAPAGPPAPPAPAQGPNADDLMRGRVPMNQTAVDVPQPVMVTPHGRQAPMPATSPRNPPQGPPPADQVHPPIQGAIPGPPIHGSAAARAARNAALEQDADSAGVLAPGGVPLPPRPAEVAVLEKKQPTADPKAAASVIDPRPAGGINPHYRPPPRSV